MSMYIHKHFTTFQW